MGWSGGTSLAEEVWSKVRKYVPKNSRETVAREVIKLFEDYDADGWCRETVLEKDANLTDDD
jgi:hypothetical protein